MASPPLLLDLFPPPLPYEDASPWQQRRALFNACLALDCAFPYLSRADWQRALDTVQPALYAAADQVLLTYDGLAQLTYYLATFMAAAPPVPSVTTRPPAPRRAARSAARRPPLTQIEAALLEQLDNVRYWRSLPLGQVVNEVLALGLRHYPEAQRPQPAGDLF
jgi:hypothetical protein